MTKPRKPKDLRKEWLTLAHVGEEWPGAGEDYEVVWLFAKHYVTLKGARRLHAWLGKAIAYLDAKEKKS